MLIIASCLILFTAGCKKDTAVEKENLLDNAKAWYLKANANSKTSLKASNDKSESLTTEFLWNTAKTYKFSDGKEVVGVQINAIMSNKYDAPGSYMLIVYKRVRILIQPLYLMKKIVTSRITFQIPMLRQLLWFRKKTAY